MAIYGSPIGSRVHHNWRIEECEAENRACEGTITYDENAPSLLDFPFEVLERILQYVPYYPGLNTVCTTFNEVLGTVTWRCNGTSSTFVVTAKSTSTSLLLNRLNFYQKAYWVSTALAEVTGQDCDAAIYSLLGRITLPPYTLQDVHAAFAKAPTEPCKGVILAACLKKGWVGNALKIVEEIEEKDRGKFAVVVKLLERMEVEKAIEIHNEILDEELSDRAKFAIVKSLSDARQEIPMEFLGETITDPKIRKAADFFAKKAIALTQKDFGGVKNPASFTVLCAKYGYRSDSMELALMLQSFEEVQTVLHETVFWMVAGESQKKGYGVVLEYVNQILDALLERCPEKKHQIEEERYRSYLKIAYTLLLLHKPGTKEVMDRALQHFPQRLHHNDCELDSGWTIYTKPARRGGPITHSMAGLKVLLAKIYLSRREEESACLFLQEHLFPRSGRPFDEQIHDCLYSDRVHGGNSYPREAMDFIDFKTREMYDARTEMSQYTSCGTLLGRKKSYKVAQNAKRDEQINTHYQETAVQLRMLATHTEVSVDLIDLGSLRTSFFAK